MSIDYQTFWEWACNRFGEENCIQNGEEVCINSPFVDFDQGNHCWCNPSKGVYHCWKSDASGKLVNLVMDHEHCDYQEATEILGGDRLLRDLEAKVAQFFANRRSVQKPKVKSLLQLPPDTFKIEALSKENRLRIIAERYLESRNIPIEGLYVCGGGKYFNRIVIPYYGPEGELIYFNCRDMTGKSKLRYQGPPKEIGIGKGDVVWMKTWPIEGSTVYLTEGEFDAMSLCQAGFNGGAAGGKNFGDKQLKLLKSYNITICFDLDKYGLEALNKVGAFMRAKQFVRGAKNDGLGYVRPAKGYKDWNDMLVKLGPNVVQLYVKGNERHLQWDDIMRLRLNSF